MPVRRSISLRQRMLIATVLTIVLALYGSHWWLASAFLNHAQRQLDQTLTRQLDQVTARLEFDPAGRPVLDPRLLSDPRFERPFSGLYWQIDRLSLAEEPSPGLLRSRSLWDEQLVVVNDELQTGQTHAHDLAGPKGEALRAVERSVASALTPNDRWRLIVAADQGEVIEAATQFKDLLTRSLFGLGFLLVIAALVQVALGLAPLRTLESALKRLRDGRSPRLEGHFPGELQPLIDDFNGVLQTREDILEQARTQAGNLAHALKTPLTILGNAAQAAPRSSLAPLVTEQVEIARRHVDWHLARARAAAIRVRPGQQIALQPVIHQLARVMRKLHAGRTVELQIGNIPDDWTIAAAEQDLQEMLGNLVDNALRNARSLVRIEVSRERHRVLIDVEDDGPGLSTEQRTAVTQRGVRLDESTPGSGLGLAIVLELAQLHGGAMELSSATSGGLAARLILPTSETTLSAPPPGQAHAPAAQPGPAHAGRLRQVRDER